jgi:hypothetical protein
MIQDIAINRILRDLKQWELISKDINGEVRSGEARLFLNTLFVVGWEEGRKSITHYSERPVIQFDKTGKRIADYSSVTEAARKLKCTRDGLYKAIKAGSITHKGHIWVYADSPTSQT